MLLKDRSISQSLIAAVSAIGKTSADKYFSERRALEEKLAAKQMKMPNQPAPKADAPAHSGAAAMANKNIKSVKEAAEGSTPRNEKEKQLAKLHGNPNKITHGDVLKGRGVRKEGWEDMLKAAKERQAAKGTGKFDVKKTSTGTVYTRKSETFDDGGKDTDLKKAEKKMKKEEAEQVVEMDSALARIRMQSQKKAQANADAFKAMSPEQKERSKQLAARSMKKEEVVTEAKVGENDEVKVTHSAGDREDVYTVHDKKTGQKSKHGIHGYFNVEKEKPQNTIKKQLETQKVHPAAHAMIVKHMTEEVVQENQDTPGNSTHQCAIHVKSEQFGEGKTLFSQHAEPDAEGNIAWYDVMFAEGIKRVNTKDIEILVSEGHMDHKKKKKM